MDRKIINFQDKKNEQFKKTSNEFLRIATEDLYTYILSKVNVSFSLLIVLGDKNLDFLNTIENEEIFINLIAKECVKKIIDIAFDVADIKLIELDNAVNDYLINDVMSRLEEWYNETILE